MVRWHRLLSALGAFFLLGALVRAQARMSVDGVHLGPVLNFVLIAAPGIALLYVGYRLPRSPVDPAFYPRVVAWTVGGVTLTGVLLAIRVAHPGVDVEFAFGTQAATMAIGSLAGLAIGVHDARALSHKKRLEAQNAALKRAREVERQNAALKRTETRLEEAVTDLEESNEQLEHFAYVASHDLQEPLRMVRSYLQLVESRYGEGLDEDGREFIAFAVDGAERMRAMIDGLLEYSRVDAQVGPFERVSLDAILDDVLVDLDVRIEETDAQLTREPLPTLDADADQLRRVFQNLLSNAIAYHGDEPPRIHVSAERDDESWVISVRDEGVGIEPDDATRIFDIFQRLHSIDERTGSGIGLAVCKRVVENHGGELWVDSVPGEGSTFRFTLPG